MQNRHLQIFALSFFFVVSTATAKWHAGNSVKDDNSWSKSTGDFGAMLVLTRHPAQFLAEWETPPHEGYVPNVKAASEVVRGEPIAAFVVFSGCSPADDGYCKSEVDFVVQDPDGDPYANIEAAELWTDKKPPPDGTLQIGVGYLAIVIEPEDLLGTYVVKADVCDKNSGSCLGLSRTFQAREVPPDLDLNDFMEDYYQDPRPAFVKKVISLIGKNGILENDDAVPPVVGFFGLVFNENSDRVSEWRSEVEDQDDSTKSAFEAAFFIGEDPSPLLTTAENSPSLNDMLWGAFSATGDARYVEAVADRLRFLGERADINLYLTAGSAQWSLASNSRQHPVVRETLKRLIETAEEPLRSALRDAVDLEPGDLRERMIEIIRQQHENGVW